MELKASLASSQNTISALQTELERTRVALQERESELLSHASKRPSSPGSNSTGVKVHVPAESSLEDDVPALEDDVPTMPSPRVTKLDVGENEEEDGWGDDW
jgi:hypothetical protein